MTRKMYHFVYLLLLMLFLNVRHCFLQQIFSGKYTTCMFTNDEMPIKNERVISLENALWDITGTIRRHESTHVRFSLCGSIPYHEKCDSNAAICIFNTKKANMNIRNAGDRFVYTHDDNGKNILRSVNGQKCDKDENFTVIIQFEENPTMSTLPKFVFMDDCELRLEMMWPLFSPTCTLKENQNLIDLRPLQKLDNFFITEPKTNKSYSLSICKKSALCGSDVAVCEVTDKAVVPISTVEQRVTYDEHHGLVLKGTYKWTGRRSKREFELHLKCKWNADGITNLTVETMTGSRKYKFKGESSLACIKFPTNCLVRSDTRDSYLLYDLSELNRGYEVRNVSGGRIRINVCDSLTLSQGNEECTGQYSQVCYQSATNEIKNLGSIPKRFEIIDYAVRGNFEEGSNCKENIKYSTEIEFICSFKAEDPTFLTIDDCTYKIKWFTPAACPKNSPQDDECILQDFTGTVNLQKLHKDDRQVPVTPSAFLRFNLCGPLKTPCQNNSDAGVCYIESGKEQIVGLLDKRLVLENNVPTLEMTGENKICGTKIKFICNYKISLEQGELTAVKIIRDGCQFEITVETPLACGSSVSYNCTFLLNNALYNLGKLSKNDGNYLITKGNKRYYLNVCRSVVKTVDVQCPPNSAICLEDNLEPHIMKRYKSLGSAKEVVEPSIGDNNELIIHYELGSYCPKGSSLVEESKIRFQCSTTEEGPQLVKAETCYHEFTWRTKHACPVKFCHYVNEVNGKSIDLSSINSKLAFHNAGDGGGYIKLSLCSGDYFECVAGTSCKPKHAELKLVSSETNIYLSYVLEHNCEPKKKPKEIRIHLVCSQDTKTFEVVHPIITNCTLNASLKTNVVCNALAPHQKDDEKSISIKSDRKPRQQHANDQKPSEDELQDEPAKINLLYHKSEEKPIQLKPDEHLEVKNQKPSEDEPAKMNLHHKREEKPVQLKPDKHLEVKSQKPAVDTSSTVNPTDEPCTNNMQKFDVKTLKNAKVTSNSGAIYSLNFENADSSYCSGLVCKDGVSMLPYTYIKCPLIEYKYTESFTWLQYKSRLVCDQIRTQNYVVEIRLKCNLEIDLPAVLEESACNVVIEYPVSEICKFYNLKTVSASSTGIVIGVTIGLVALLFFLVSGIVYFRKRRTKVDDYSRISMNNLECTTLKKTT